MSNQEQTFFQSETPRVKGLFLESVIYTIDEHSTITLGVRNVIIASMTLHASTLIGQLFPYLAAIRVMEDEKPCHGVSHDSPSSPHNVFTSSSHDMLHRIDDFDFPEARQDLLYLLSYYRKCVSLPSEPL